MSKENLFYELQDVAKSYVKGGEKVKVLERLNLDIREGEFVAIMGPSGSGKSTLFNILGGLDTPDSGKAMFSGKDSRSFGASGMDRWRARHVGFIFQFYHLIPVLTTYQNIEIPLLLTSLSRRERKEKVETTLSLMGLEDRSRHYPNQLSGGQQQRVAIARAIVTNPSVILADEPTGDLDAKTAEEIGKIIRQLNKDFHKTVAIFTHDMKIAGLADRLLQLENGNITGR